MLEALAERATQRASAQGAEVFSYDDVAAVVADWGTADFLREIIPRRMTAAAIVERMLPQNAKEEGLVTADQSG